MTNNNPDDEYNTLEEALRFVDCPVCKGVGEYPSPKPMDFTVGPFGVYRHAIECEACKGKGKVKK